MTKINIEVDNTVMFMTAAELQKQIEKLRLERDWSLLRVAKEAAVPYSWLVDLYRNKPRKPDMERAQKVLAVLQKTVKHPINMTQTESALFEALQIIIGAQAVQGNFVDTMKTKLSDQQKDFEAMEQPDAAGVIGGLLEFLQHRLPKQAIPRPQQSLQPARNQSGNEINLKNQP